MDNNGEAGWLVVEKKMLLALLNSPVFVPVESVLRFIKLSRIRAHSPIKSAHVAGILCMCSSSTILEHLEEVSIPLQIKPGEEKRRERWQIEGWIWMVL
ncbi:hypothetical protein SRHO_G00123200 [Serrasalmus rhombeus]